MKNMSNLQEPETARKTQNCEASHDFEATDASSLMLGFDLGPEPTPETAETASKSLFQKLSAQISDQWPPSATRTDGLKEDLQPYEETIPTAIVIKNIPFNLKKESLLDLFTALDMPRPYALNYHFYQGVFRGLAFANFYSAEETQIVLKLLNNVDVQGRKLRVELKRLLPAAEREKAEKDKRDRKLLEKKRSRKLLDIDMNDSVTLNLYSQVLLFRDDPTPNSPTTKHFGCENINEKRIIQLIAEKLGLDHYSDGEGDGRHVVVARAGHGRMNTSSPSDWSPSSPIQLHDSMSFNRNYFVLSKYVPYAFPDVLSINTSHRKQNLDFKEANSAPIMQSFPPFSETKKLTTKENDDNYSLKLSNLMLTRKFSLNSKANHLMSRGQYETNIGPQASNFNHYLSPTLKYPFTGVKTPKKNQKAAWPFMGYESMQSPIKKENSNHALLNEFKYLDMNADENPSAIGSKRKEENVSPFKLSSGTDTLN